MSPSKARAFKDERAVESIPSNRGENISVVAAMTSSGIQQPMMLKRSMDTLAFEAWLE